MQSYFPQAERDLVVLVEQLDTEKPVVTEAGKKLIEAIMKPIPGFA